MADFKEHKLDDKTRVVTLRKCWSVWFDVNGNAPTDALVASFATEELAKEALALFVAQRYGDKTVAITKNGKKYTKLPRFVVEGYEFDTYFTLRENWSEEEAILTNLAELTELCEEVEDTSEPDGITIEGEE